VVPRVSEMFGIWCSGCENLWAFNFLLSNHSWCWMHAWRHNAIWRPNQTFKMLEISQAAWDYVHHYIDYMMDHRFPHLLQPMHHEAWPHQCDHLEEIKICPSWAPHWIHSTSHGGQGGGVGSERLEFTKWQSVCLNLYRGGYSWLVTIQMQDSAQSGVV